MISHISPVTPEAFRRRRSHSLLLAFVSIAAVFIASNFASLYRAREIEQGTHVILEDMLASVDLASRMGRDIAQERRLVDAHILTNEAGRMSDIEAQIDSLESDFAKAAVAYEPLTTLPGENEMWRQLQADVQTIRAPLTETLALSRRNEDVEAGENLRRLDGRFDDITEDVNTLIQINRKGAQYQVQQVAALQRSETWFLTILTFAGIVVTIIVAWWAIRLVGQRERQLAHYSLLLESRNRDLDAFAARVAHDLRAPLSNIGLAVMKLSTQVPVGDEAVGILQRGVSRMDALIGDLLTLSRAGSEEVAACDPAAAAAQVRKDLASRLEHDGGTIRVDVVPAKVRGSEGLLRQALWNLAENAVKYRRPEVPVEVEIAGRRERQNYELRVSDNGIGMAPEESSKAFDPFYRARQSREVPGTGLGLSIVKRVIEVSGGTVSVFSQVGKGTTFIISLPLADE